MTNIIRAILVSSILMLLSACGGGGGSAGNTSGSAFFTTAAEKITIVPGEVLTYNLGGGVPGYVAASSSGAATAIVNGNKLIISGISGGTAIITVSDSSGAQVKIEATIGTGVEFFTTAPSEVTVGVGTNSSTYELGGGSRSYSVSSSNKQVVVVTQSGSQFYLTGVSYGKATISATDTFGGNKQIDVTVGPGTNFFTTAPVSITLITGEIPSFSIIGGTLPYTVTSNNSSVAKTELVGQKSFSIAGVNAGTAEITIFDALGASVKVLTTVISTSTIPLDILPGDVTGNVGDTLVFKMNGGTPNFTLTNNNPSIATIITSVPFGAAGTFTAKLLNVGITDVTVVDAQNQIKKIKITANNASTLLRLSPASLTIGEDATETISLSIYGGTAPYRAFTSDLVMSKVTVDGATFDVAVGTQGTRCVRTIDATGNYVPGGTYLITFTVIDSLGASATSTMAIKDNSKGGAGCL